jgi:hypothetical protein
VLDVANVSQTYREHMIRDFAPTSLSVHVEDSEPIELSKEGEMTLTLSYEQLIHNRMNLETLEAQIGLPGMLSQVENADFTNGLSGTPHRFDLGLCWILPQIRKISVNGAPSLQHLHLGEIEIFTAEDFHALLQTVGPNLKSLRLCDLTWSSAIPGAPRRHISDGELDVISQHCRQLESIAFLSRFQSISTITTIGISSILRNNPGVKTLKLLACPPELDGVDLVRLFARDCCRQLEEIQLGELSLGDTDLIGIVQSLPELHTIILFDTNTSMKRVTTAGLRRALEVSSTLGGGGTVWVPNYRSRLIWGPGKTELKKLAEDFPNVTFSDSYYE